MNAWIITAPGCPEGAGDRSWIALGGKESEMCARNRTAPPTGDRPTHRRPVRLHPLQEPDRLEEVEGVPFANRCSETEIGGLHNNLCSPARGGHRLSKPLPDLSLATSWLNELIETYRPRNRSSTLANRKTPDPDVFLLVELDRHLDPPAEPRRLGRIEPADHPAALHRADAVDDLRDRRGRRLAR